jgi:hypothetical protein
MINKRNPLTVRYLANNIAVVLGLVLMWRGIWYLLDGIDSLFFAGDHLITAALGVLVGLLILYLPDGDLKEIQKL